MAEVPTTFELARAVTFVEAIGHAEHFGKGTPEDPLFPVEVELIGESSHSFAITGRVERAAKAYLRSLGIDREYARPIEEAIRRELWSSESYEELLVRAMSLVEAI